jgi:superfamily II DNA/RNA helicase
MSFNTFDLHPDLLRGVAALGFDTPTPIQRDAIPPVHAGRDVSRDLVFLNAAEFNSFGLPA